MRETFCWWECSVRYSPPAPKFNTSSATGIFRTVPTNEITNHQKETHKQHWQADKPNTQQSPHTTANQSSLAAASEQLHPPSGSDHRSCRTWTWAWWSRSPWRPAPSATATSPATWGHTANPSINRLSLWTTHTSASTNPSPNQLLLSGALTYTSVTP